MDPKRGKAATASSPFHACATSTPFMESSSVVISMLTSLSSASSMRLPASENVSSPPSAAGCPCGRCRRAMAKGSMMVKVVPSPGALIHVNLAVHLRDDALGDGMPRPVPTACRSPKRISRL